MAKLITQLNKTSGNYQDVFIFTVNASFNGIQDSIKNAQIKILFPDFLTIYLGDIQDPIQNVTTELLADGKLYTFEFGAITDLGIAVRIGIGAMFSPSTKNGTSVSILPELWINNEQYLSSTADTIQLQVISDYRLSHELIIPQIAPSENSIAYYRVLLKNYGDLGASINNILISCNVNDKFIIDNTYAIIGKDISSDNFKDSSQDGIVGSIDSNTITFAIEKFYGEAYEFIYRVIAVAAQNTSEDNAANNNEAGYSLDTTLFWSIDDTVQEEISSPLLISEPLYNVSSSLYGPDYSLPGRLTHYEASFSNTGNQALDNLILTVTFPNEVIIETFTSGIYKLHTLMESLDLSYQISYRTTSGISGIIGTYSTDNNQSIASNAFVDANDSLRSLSWEFSTFPVGFTAQSIPVFDGYIMDTTPIGSILICDLNISFFANNIANSNQKNCVTRLQDICILTPTFSSSSSNIPVKPGEVFQYTIGANCRRSRLNTPVFQFFLPAKLRYVGNVTSNFYDYFKSQSPLSVPEPRIILNANDNFDTLIEFAFTDTFSDDLQNSLEDSYERDFEQHSRIRITFDVEVLSTARGSFSSYFRMFTVNSDSESAQSNMITNSILFFLSISSRKEAQGFLDRDFRSNNTLASTLSGETVTYQINITNTGNADFDSIELIDILPYPQDTGVIETTVSRESDFPIYLSTEVSAKIISPTAPSNATSENSSIYDSTYDFPYTLYYSTSNNPVRFGNSFNIIGETNNWSLTPPELMSTVRSIKFVKDEAPLLPGETLSLLFNTTVPYGLKSGLIAWNSFAADVAYTDMEGNKQHLLAIEPDKIGVQILAPDTSKGRISGFVFWDEEKTGYYSNSLSRTTATNDIGVVLYNSRGLPLRYTFTATNIEGLAGQYSFSNLDLDQYFIRFFIDTDIHDFSKQHYSSFDKYSNVNISGITPMIDLSTTQYQDNVIAGIHSNTERRVNEVLQINRNSNQMLRNVIYDQMLIGMKLEDTDTLL